MTNESPNKPFLIDSILVVSITDTEGNITYASDRFYKLSQYTCEELIGQNHSIINSGYHPQDFFREMWKTISDGGIWEGEICNRAKNGSLFWSSARIAPLIEGNGKPSQYIAVYNDITSLKETEDQLRGNNHLPDQSLDNICRKESEAELRRILQLSKIGEWTAGLAHEIKNPLAGIKGVVDVLIQRQKSNNQDKIILKSVLHEVNRMESMVEELLNNVRIRPICFEVASLNKTIECVFQIADLQNSIAANGHKKSVFKLDLPDEPIIIPHDSLEIEGVMLNLILNAKANIENGKGRIEIRLSKETKAENSVALIEVTDNGRGIPPDSLSKIFTPFYTTGKNGTGLGLAAVQRIVEAHNGSCEVFSEVGRGTTFQIRLPIR